MQLFSSPGRDGVPPVQPFLGMWDSRDARKALQDLRIRHGHQSVPDFAELIGVGKTTVYRIENWAELPKHEPSIETIVRELYT